MEKKLTKKDFYAMLTEIVGATEVEMKEDLLAFIDKEVSLIDAKAEKAKARAAEKKAEGDALRDAVQAVLTEEYQTINDIASQVEGEEITKAKITARLTSLVKNGLAEKADVKTEDGKTVKAYKLV
mgnify:CR=1 FL=1